MMTATCPDRATLELLLLGKLPRPQFDTLSEHLRTCDVCAASADTLSLQDDWTNALRTPPTPEEQPQLLAQAIERAKALRGVTETMPPDASLPTYIGSIEQAAALTGSPTGPQIDKEEIRFLAPPLLPDEIGRLGSYRILQILGVGGMGIVFRAEDPRLKRQVALKAMKPAVAASPAAKDRFLREAQFTAALEHDNIVHIYQVDEVGGVPYIAMQFLRGESLKTRLERVVRLPERDVVRIGKEIAAGLAAAHKRGLIHRDIKPDNIWLEAETDRVKILDFGLVRAADDDAGLTQSGMVLGTPRYMAPEQAQGHEVDHRCDLFSLGSVLYHLAAGQTPFAGNNLTATLMAVVHQDPPPLAGVCADVSPELEALILKLLAKNREERPQAAAEVCATLTKLEHELRQPRDRTDATLKLKETTEFPPIAAPVSITVAPPLRSSGKGSGRRWSARGIALAAGAGAAALLLGVIIITITSKDGTKTTIRVSEGVDTDVETAPGSKVKISQSDNPSDPEPSTLNSQTTGWHGWPSDAPKPAIAPFDAAQAKKHQEEWAAYLKVPVEYTNSIGMKFMLIPPGEFQMGSTPAENEAALKEAATDPQWVEYIKSESPQHKVILSQPFYLGAYEVTQSEYQQVMGKNPSAFAQTGLKPEDVKRVEGMETSTHPVEQVSWVESAEFCIKLSQQEKLKPHYFRADGTVTLLEGTGCRLPSEAEWEMACRAGTLTRFWSGDSEEDLLRVAWCAKNSAIRTHAVGELKANPFGLWDVHGNVYEWVQDGWDAAFYSQFVKRPAVDPVSPFSPHSLAVVRGSHFHENPVFLGSADRYVLHPSVSGSQVGFRIAMPVDAVRAAIAEAATSMAAHKTGWHGWPVDAPQPAIAPFDAAQAKKHQEEWAAYLKVPVEYTNSLGMKFRLIPPGEFTMGSTAEEIAAVLKDVPHGKHFHQSIQSEAPQHKVILTQPIYLGVNEVTQAEYEKVMGSNPSHFALKGMGKEAVAGLETAEHPVEMVSWNDAAEFCAKLSEQEKLKPFYFRAGETITPLDGTGYRLPSEAGWEFACRAGTATKYWIGDNDEDLVRAGWFGGNAGGRTHAAGELKANPFGLSDIHSNVWEWVQDGWDATWYGQFQEKLAINPSSPFSAASQRVIRGGHWNYNASFCRSSSRIAHDPTSRSGDVGFRVSLSVATIQRALMHESIPLTNTPWHGWPADAPQPAIAPFDAAQAKKHQEEWAAYLKVPVEYTNSIGMKFRLIPPGEFLMGSPPEEIAAALKLVDPNDMRGQESVKSEAPQHKVILTRPLYLAVNEVTQAEYAQVMGGNPSYHAPTGMGKEAVAGLDTAQHPVEMVSWNDAIEFSNKLSQQETLKPFYLREGEILTLQDGTGYRLPSDAEWEYACRGGTTTKCWIGDKEADLLQVGWFAENGMGRTHPVGQMRANPFGLCDMHGNVWEWTQDSWVASWYSEFQNKPAMDPQSPFAVDSMRVVRGSQFWFYSYDSRSSTRHPVETPRVHGDLGFRVTLTIDAVQQELARRVSTKPVTSKSWHGWPADAPKPAMAPFDAAQAKQHQEEWAAYLKVPVEYTNNIGMKFRLIPPGEFTMGSTPEEIAEALKDANFNDKAWPECIQSEGPQHKVILTQPVYLGVTEVTQGEYEKVMGVNPSHFAPDGRGKGAVVGLEAARHPVEDVSWNSAAEFCARLGQHEKLKLHDNDSVKKITPPEGADYRLPSEAEWEFACRAGTITKYWIGDQVEELAQAGWFGGNSRGRTHAVGELKPNPFGLFDIHGNVWEWVQDGWNATGYGQFLDKPAINPISQFSTSARRVIRGGDWRYPESGCRSSDRNAVNPASRVNGIGFRACLTVAAVREAR